MTCKLCDKTFLNPNGFGNHIKSHNIETKEYYDLFLKKNDEEGICKYCHSEKTEFISFTKGYRDHCSRSCSKHYQPNCKGWIHKEGSSSWNKGIEMNQVYKQNWTKSNPNFGKGPSWNKGIEMDPEFKKRWLKIMVERVWKPHSEETIKNMRIRAIENLQINYPRYNPKACEYFNQMMKESNMFIQHAENLGELHIKELGYFVDGYDKENNTVYEYDEKHHYKCGKLTEKDIKRQKEITKFLNCKFIRIKE